MSTLKTAAVKHPSSTGTAITLDASDNVGIGTATPDRIIHFNKSGTEQNVRAKFTNGTTGVGASNGFEIGINASNPADAVLVNYENSPMAFFTNGSERLRIQSGGGISFNGDTAAANALDDYEEGSATLTMYGSGATPATPLTFTAKYTKIGSQVSIFGSTTGSPNTTGYSGYPYFGGLPYTPSTGGMGNAMGYNAFTFSYDGGLVCYWDTGGYAYIYENASGTYWRTININPTTSIGIKISGIYYTF